MLTTLLDAKSSTTAKKTQSTLGSAPKVQPSTKFIWFACHHQKRTSASSQPNTILLTITFTSPSTWRSISQNQTFRWGKGCWFEEEALKILFRCSKKAFSELFEKIFEETFEHSWKACRTKKSFFSIRLGRKAFESRKSSFWTCFKMFRAFLNKQKVFQPTISLLKYELFRAFSNVLLVKKAPWHRKALVQRK